MVEKLFGIVFIWGIQALLVWSLLLAIKHAAEEKKWGFIAFFIYIFHYAKASFGTWIGLVAIVFGIGILSMADKLGEILGGVFFLLFGIVVVYWCFPRKEAG
ncbi:hypothetical protein [Paenibacillus soyae]|uniref:Uncharacterized protein n=1 Tax=Paenibacillus soyae TaxID=2969249 RepID=A0A9X2MV72_9BACL|nr:hypothetical protein [Paenibacillus soyae]MCR2806927.1 hypothetical protein [Paenibacillus soyae]